MAAPGTGAGELSYPYDIRVDEAGNQYRLRVRQQPHPDFRRPGQPDRDRRRPRRRAGTLQQSVEHRPRFRRQPLRRRRRQSSGPEALVRRQTTDHGPRTTDHGPDGRRTTDARTYGLTDSRRTDRDRRHALPVHPSRLAAAASRGGALAGLVDAPVGRPGRALAPLDRPGHPPAGHAGAGAGPRRHPLAQTASRA